MELFLSNSLALYVTLLWQCMACILVQYPCHCFELRILFLYPKLFQFVYKTMHTIANNVFVLFNACRHSPAQRTYWMFRSVHRQIRCPIDWEGNRLVIIIFICNIINIILCTFSVAMSRSHSSFAFGFITRVTFLDLSPNIRSLNVAYSSIIN